MSQVSTPIETKSPLTHSAVVVIVDMIITTKVTAAVEYMIIMYVHARTFVHETFHELGVHGLHDVHEPFPEHWHPPSSCGMDGVSSTRNGCVYMGSFLEGRCSGKLLKVTGTCDCCCCCCCVCYYCCGCAALFSLDVHAAISSTTRFFFPYS